MLSGLVTIPAGQRQATITVVPLDDLHPDPNKTVILRLLTSTNVPPAYLAGFPRSAAAVIVDDGGFGGWRGLLPDGCFHLAQHGTEGASFRIEYSTDMTSWQPVCTNQVINGSVNFVDPDAKSSPARFYRAVPLGGDSGVAPIDPGVLPVSPAGTSSAQ
jgi:hypothetical protein